MKKIIIVVLIIFLFFFFQPKEEIRVRVIPNSNEENDLVIKNRVQKKTKEILEELLKDKKEYNEIEETIKGKINYFDEQLSEIADVNVSFKKHNMGIKSYNDKVITGNELTLLIEIGEAKGDNWWGTLYPNLLGISTEESVSYEFWINKQGE